MSSLPAPQRSRHALDACFLGPYGENDALLEKLVVEFLRDHVYWRRNFHPEDPPAIPTHAYLDPGYQDFEARLRRELHQLSAALKKSVPFHSPRYLGHMVSDLLIPGLAAQILTLPYNPNNVSEDAAPVTVDLEVQVGLQLARMLPGSTCLTAGRRGWLPNRWWRVGAGMHTSRHNGLSIWASPTSSARIRN